MGNAERLLVLLLRLAGAVMCLAAPALVMPTGWMAACHRWLGLGEFPPQPLAEYLARCTSGLFAVFGAALLVLSCDVGRYGPAIRVLAIGYVLVAAVVFAFMARLGGRAALYSAADAASAVACFGAVLYLQRRIPVAGDPGASCRNTWEAR